VVGAPADAREHLGEHERAIVPRSGGQEDARREHDHPDREDPALADAVREGTRRELKDGVGHVEDREQCPGFRVGDGEVVHQER